MAGALRVRFGHKRAAVPMSRTLAELVRDSASPELAAYVEAHAALLVYAGQLPQAGGPMLKPVREACYKSAAALRDALEVRP